MSMDTVIPCPDCGTPIPYRASMLLEGTAFVCPNPDCRASIAMAPESAATWTSAADAFETLKAKTLTAKDAEI
ncbi:MAG: hypothetical protein AAFW87_06150 [Pseudomonadota bacterium]